MAAYFSPSLLNCSPSSCTHVQTHFPDFETTQSDLMTICRRIICKNRFKLSREITDKIQIKCCVHMHAVFNAFWLKFSRASINWSQCFPYASMNIWLRINTKRCPTLNFLFISFHSHLLCESTLCLRVKTKRIVSPWLHPWLEQQLLQRITLLKTRTQFKCLSAPGRLMLLAHAAFWQSGNGFKSWRVKSL